MKILSLFNQSKEEKQEKANLRAAKALKRGQEALIDKLEADKDKLLGKMEKLLDVSSGSVASNWNEEFQAAKVDLVMKEKEIELAKETNKEYFSEGTKA